MTGTAKTEGTTYPLSIPADSLIAKSFTEVHYSDAFAADLPAQSAASPVEAARAFFVTIPRWITALLVLRNLPAKMLGLKTGEGHTMEDMADAPCEPGRTFGFFTVMNRTADEVLMGERDRHLDFYFSVMVRTLPGKTVPSVIMATTVHFNNLLGRLYFIPVRPFHRVIVRSMLTRTARSLMMKKARSDQGIKDRGGLCQ